MIALPNNKVEKVIQKFDSKISVMKRDVKVRLNEFRINNPNLNSIEEQYFENLLEHIDDLITAPQSLLFTRYKKIFKKYPSKKKNTIKKKILEALGYENYRKNFYPAYFQELGIKSCVYCNANLTVAIDTSNGDKKAKFQIDHYLPKSSYPCFSISLYNLYPVCASCNNVKGKKMIDFELYSKSSSQSNFYFKLDKTSLIDYMQNRKSENLKFTFNQPSQKKNKSNYKNLFDIEGIYETQKNIIEELILKSEIYTPSYKKSLKDEFPEIFNDVSLSNRIIIGNYCEEDEIHKRPMSKFTQDIAKQVGLL